VVEIGINPSFAPRLKELMNQFGTPSITYRICNTACDELADPQTSYCVQGFGCLFRDFTSKGIVKIFPLVDFRNIVGVANASNLPIEYIFASELTQALTGGKGPGNRPITQEIVARGGVVVKIK